MSSASSGRPTGYSIARVARRLSVDRRRPVDPEAAQICHAGSEGVAHSSLHERRERLVQPDALPPAHRDQVAEPHVRRFVGDASRHPLPLDLRAFLARRAGPSPGRSPARGFPSPRRRSQERRCGRACPPGRAWRSNRRRKESEMAAASTPSRPGAAAGDRDDADGYAVHISWAGQSRTARSRWRRGRSTSSWCRRTGPGACRRPVVPRDRGSWRSRQTRVGHDGDARTWLCDRARPSRERPAERRSIRTE